ncbi:hypothetical protein [Anaeromyxobacter diazotrophicus]|uniref:Uncharacterized protein n=1 Tax=Anaeromyxobacter diazotrophicus TaxID=2590199 RepID=A0A7I9VPQ6_9BACT|nr:hypothetical protein [Anaeromyxobacter diazotrophicus]GEJ58375.1 hypothetical protein AMYX_31160 [Anaeromyxobacter diazotrophicus]
MGPKDVQLLGRVALERAVRLGDIAPEAPAPAPAADADVRCPGCGASLCDATRRALFVGMVLRCGCGEKARVERAP